MYETYSKELRQLMVVVDSATYHPDSLFRQAGYSRAELIAHLQRPLQNLLAYPHLLTVRLATHSAVCVCVCGVLISGG
jgi:hypothetical protein